MLTIYKASAGSGKTYQLALHFIKMVLGVKDSDNKWKLNPLLLTDAPSLAHRHILAITFTNKATEEMKSRIIANLDAIAKATKSDEQDYIPTLTAEFGCSFEELRTAAHHALTSILLDFSFFNVSTIDSFFQTVLRTFARELGIQGDYNIELNSKEAVRLALNLLLDNLNSPRRGKEDPKNRTIREWLDNRALNKTGKFSPFKRVSKDFDNMVKEIQKIYSEDFQPQQEELYKYLENPDNLKKFEGAIDAELLKIPDMIEKAKKKVFKGIESSGQAMSVKKNVTDFIRDFSVEKFSTNVRKLSVPLVRALAGDENGQEFQLNGGKEPNDIYLDAIRCWATNLRNIYALWRTLMLLKSKVAHLQFISVMIDYIEKVREENNLLVLNDTSSYISRIIGNDDVPFIYERLGTHLHHFLIDEFQDTSRLQWKNLYPLVDNSHANGDDSLIIGDVKQAIYRFRNSDASILGNSLQEYDFPDEENRLLRGVTREENCNYRTAHGIVRFNNTIMPPFASIVLKEENPDGYVGSSVQQMYSSRKAHLRGRISLFPYDYKYNPAEDDTPAVFDITDVKSFPIIPDEETKIKVIIDNIRAQYAEDGHWNEIAVLFRFSKNVKNVVKGLLDAGIPVQSAESLYLKNAPSIRQLVSLLHMLAGAGIPSPHKAPDEETRVYRSEKSKYMDYTLFESRYNFFLYQGGPGGTPLTPQEAIEKALDLSAETSVRIAVTDKEKGITSVPKSLEDAIRFILHKHPATLVATVEAILSSGLIQKSTIKSEKDYIAAFTDLVLNYSDTFDNDLNGFLQWWDQHQNTATVLPPPDCNAVRILSIHRAKGLEFKHVHLIDFDWELIDDRESAWLDIRPADASHPLNLENIDLGLSIPRELYPPVVCCDITETDFPNSPFSAYLENRYKLMRTDALNIAYVGLTRPINSLSVYYGVDSSGSGNEPDTVGKALASVLESIVSNPQTDSEDCLTIPEDAFNKDSKAMYLDIPPTKEKAKKSEPEKDVSEQTAKDIETYSATYTSVFPADMKSIVNVESLDPTDFMDEDIDDNTPETDSVNMSELFISQRKRQKMEKTQRGLDMHEILSHIISVNSDEDFEDVFERALTQAMSSDGFNTADTETYRQIVRDMLSHPEAARWFSPDSRIDTELSYHKPYLEGENADDTRLGVTRRIDRLVELPDGSIEIVDYKFTQVRDLAYHDQVREYMEATARIFPGRPIRGYLWYYDLNRIDPVT